MIEITLANYKATPEMLQLGTSGSWGNEQIKIIRGENWENLTVTATFSNGCDSVTVIAGEDDLFAVPTEATAKAVSQYAPATLVFAGYANGNRRFSANAYYYVVGHGPGIGGNEGEPTETILEQILEGERERQEAETARVDAELGRVEAEEQRVESEAQREQDEQARTAAELARVSAENARMSAEAARESAEASRVSAEQSRVTAEQNRVTAESARVIAEQNRVNAEAGRVAAEAQRVTETAEAIQRVDDVLEDLDGVLASKMHMVQLYSDMAALYKDADYSEQITFAEIAQLLENPQNEFEVLCIDEIVLKHALIIPDPDPAKGRAIEFTGTLVLRGEVWLERLIYSETDELLYTEHRLEEVANKASAITDANKGSTEQYTSVKAVSDYAAKADDLAAVTEYLPNMLYVGDMTINGVTISHADNGSLILNGTAAGGFFIPVLTLNAGTFTAKYQNAGGSISTSTGLSLRYKMGSPAETASGTTRWVNNSVHDLTISVESVAYIYLSANNRVTFTNFNINIMVSAGGEVPPEFQPGGKTAVDKIARESAKTATDAIDEIKETEISEGERSLIAGGLKELSDVYAQYGEMLTFAYITDTHIDTYQTARDGVPSLKLFNDMAHFGHFAAHLGDVVQSTGRTLPEALQNVEYANRLMHDVKTLAMPRGNHDTNTRSGQQISTELFNAITAQKHLPGFVTNPADSNKSYGYVDFDDYKVRLIVLDAYDARIGSELVPGDQGYVDSSLITSKQVEWIGSLIPQSGWSVCILSHPYISSVLEAGEASGQNTAIKAAIAQYNYASIPCVWINGDQHEDKWNAVLTADKGRCLDITIDNAFAEDTDAGNDKYCLGFICIGKTETEGVVMHHVHDIRIGRGQSRHWAFGCKVADIHILE